CIARFHRLVEVVDNVYGDRDSFPRLVSKMWTYSLFDALQREMFGGPISGRRDAKPRSVSVNKVRATLRRINSRIEADDLPLSVERATRGGATDKGSREARAAYLAKSFASK